MNTASSRVRASESKAPRAFWQFLSERASTVISAIRSRIPSAWGGSAKHYDADFAASLDIDRISVRLDIENRARADGKHDQPPPTEEVVTGTQKEIIVYFKQLQQQARNHVVRLGDQLRDQREIIDLSESTARLHDIPSRCENEMRRRIADFESEIRSLDEKERHYESLQQNTGGEYTDKRDRLPRFYYLLMAILIGSGTVTIINQLAPGTIAPALLSAAWATAISLLYVMVPLLLGVLVFRASFGRGYVSKLALWLGVGAAIAFVSIAAGFAAHLITALSAGQVVTLDGVKDAMLSTPLAVATNVVSWTGFSMVAFAGLLAFLLGYRSGDSRLDLRAAARRTFLRTRDGREARTRQMRKRINAVVDGAESEVGDLLQNLKMQIRHYSQLVETAKRTPEFLNDYDIALEDACNILLDRYRASNGRARRTDWPVSFSEHVCFRLEKAPASAMVGDEEKRLEKMHRGVAKLESEVSKVRQQLRDLNWRAIRDLTEGRAQLLPLSSSNDDAESSVLPTTRDPVVGVSSVEALSEHASASNYQRPSRFA